MRIKQRGDILALHAGGYHDMTIHCHRVFNSLKGKKFCQTEQFTCPMTDLSVYPIACRARIQRALSANRSNMSSLNGGDESL
jgi:hypothetical protein